MPKHGALSMSTFSIEIPITLAPCFDILSLYWPGFGCPPSGAQHVRMRESVKEEPPPITAPLLCMAISDLPETQAIEIDGAALVSTQSAGRCAHAHARGGAGVARAGGRGQVQEQLR